jgi:HK97 family phage prohead protease
VTAPATPPAAVAASGATEEVITAVSALIMAGATVAEVKAALLSLEGMTTPILDKIFTSRKFPKYVRDAVDAIVKALPPVVDAPEPSTGGDKKGTSAPVPVPPDPKPDTGTGSQKSKTASKPNPFHDQSYIPSAVKQQIDAALKKKGKARPGPKRPPAASTFVKLKGAANEAMSRGAYLTAAARRLQPAYDSGDQALIDAAELAEDRYAALHEQAVKERARAVRAVAKRVVGKTPDENGEILLGWYAHISPATCARCLAADGKNFDALEPPPIGYPGTVHPHDHCLPGPPHATDERVELVDPDIRGSVRQLTRRYRTERTAQMKTETRTAKVVEVRGGNADKPDEKPGFTARAVVYGVPDTYRTSWQQGVFQDALEERMPSVVWNHDWADPVGRVVAYRDSSGGLDIDVEFDDFEAVPRARQAHAQMRSGTMDQFSFAFIRGEEEQDPNHRGVMRQVKAGLQEFSIVLNGSVPGTHSTSVRSAQTLDADTAAELLKRFAAGDVELDAAIAEVRAATKGAELAKPAYEFRAVDGGAEGADPSTVLASVDAAMASVADQLDKEDVEAARRFFQQAASRLSELQYLLGMVPGLAPDSYAWRTEAPAEQRTEEGTMAADDPTKLALERLVAQASGSWMRGRGGRR